MILNFGLFQLGLVGILFIAIATDHCCTLIVKCKRIVIKKLCQRMAAEGYVEYHIEKQEKILGRTLSFGQIGRVSMGTLGIFLVDTSIVITQFGFCIGYFIFLGNTMRSVVFAFLQYQHVGFTNTSNSFPINSTNFTTLSAMNILTSTKYPATFAPSTAEVTTTGVQDFLTTLPKLAKVNGTGNGTDLVPTNNSFPTPFFNITTISLLNVTSVNKTSESGFISKIISKMKNHLTNIKEKLVNMDNPITHNTLQENKAWTFALLLVVPAPLLILISFIRNIRKLGPVSVLANGSITGAFFATAVYILVGELNGKFIIVLSYLLQLLGVKFYFLPENENEKSKS